MFTNVQIKMAKKPTKKPNKRKRKLATLSDRIEDVKESTREGYRQNNPASKKPTSPKQETLNDNSKRKKKDSGGILKWISDNF